MQEFIEEITEEDARQLKSLLREGVTKIRKTLEQLTRDDEEIARLRHRSALLMADTQAVLDRLDASDVERQARRESLVQRLERLTPSAATKLA